MEINPFDPSRHETSSASEDDGEGSTYKKKKKTNLRPPLFEPKESAPAAGSEAAKSVGGESLWRKLLGQPEDEIKPAAEKAGETADEAAAADAEKPAELSEEEAAQLPLEELSPEEQAAVVQEYLAARQAALIGEQAHAVEGDDEQQAAEQAADLALLDAARQLLREHPEEPFEQPLQRAYEQVAEHFGVRDEAATEPLAGESATPAAEASPPSPDAPATWYVRDAAPTATHDTPAAFAPRRESTPATAATKPEVQDNHTGAALLVGAAVGYLVGRRRGRIKTEKQAAKVEKKLTTQIRNLERIVAEKEQRIRTVAREAYVRVQATRGVSSEALHGRKAQMAPAEQAAATPARLPARERERLGAVTLKAVETMPVRATDEAVPANRVQSVEQASKAEKLAAKSVADMSRSELIEKAATVSVGATNLRRVYETKLITEQGLRRLLVEHERGGNVQQMLKRELVEKESSFERDPRLRNRGAVGALAAGAVVALPTTPTIDASAGAVATAAKSGTAKPSPVPPASAGTLPPSQIAAIATVIVLVLVIAWLLYILFTGR